MVWITGGGSGIGRELALAFAREGAAVAVSGRRQERLDEVAAELDATAGSGLAVHCDVTDEESVAAAVATVVESLGRLDVAVANAGFAVAGKVETLSAADWRRQFETNVIGLTSTARAAIPHLKQTQGRLALVGSVSSFVAMPGVGPYHSSKYAVRAIGQTLSMELHGSGVSCTTIHPGFVESEIAQVDNRGRFNPKRPDRRPAKLMWAADRAARVMVNSIHRRQRERVFTGHGRVIGWIGRHMPGAAHFFITRSSVKYGRN